MNRIEQLRKENGLSQQQLAERLNVHQTAVSQWEKGRTTPNVETVMAIAELFNADPWYILGVGSVKGCWPPQQHSIGRLETAYNQLNEKGQSVAVERVEELTEIPRYQKQKTPADGE